MHGLSSGTENSKAHVRATTLRASSAHSVSFQVQTPPFTSPGGQASGRTQPGQQGSHGFQVRDSQGQAQNLWQICARTLC